jgi:hypothetical protein
MTDRPSDSMPLNGEAELTIDERKAIRRIIRDTERASWVWQMLRAYVPWLTTIIGGVGTALYWLITNFTARGGPPP